MLLRRSAPLLSRLGPALAAAAAEGGSSSSAWAPHSAAALQLLHSWHHGGSSGQGAGWQQQSQHMAVRHLSLWPGGGSKQQQQQQPDSLAAAGEDFGASSGAAGFDAAASAAADGSSGLAAAAAATPGVADLLNAGTIVAAAALAEDDALAAAREDSWLGTRLIQSVLTGVHSYLGLEWWQSIVVATLGMRIAALPLMVSQVKNTYRMSLARPEIEALMEHLKADQARGNADAAAAHHKRVLEVWAKYNCNPLKSLMSLFVQAPIFIGFFSTLRGFALHKVPSLTEGGALWFTDLTVADPTFALPILAGLTFLLTVELGAADGMQGQPEEMQRRMKALMRAVAVAVPVLSYSMPASVFMYWTASNLFSLLQTTVLKVPAVKRVLGLPDLAKLRQPAPDAALAGKPAQLFTYSTRPRDRPKGKKAEEGQQQQQQ